MAEKEFIFRKDVYYGDVNMFGNVHFARYFEWQGMAREEFFKRLVGNYEIFFKSGIKIFTIEAYIRYRHEITLFNEVIIKVKPDNIGVCTVDLIFKYLNKSTNKLMAEGRQKIGFVDSKNKVIPIPREVKEKWGRFKKC